MHGLAFTADACGRSRPVAPADSYHLNTSLRTKMPMSSSSATTMRMNSIMTRPPCRPHPLPRCAVILARRWAVRREAEEEWNKVRPRRGLFDMDQEALVLRSPTARLHGLQRKYPWRDFKSFRQALERRKCGVPAAAFQVAEIGPVHAGSLRNGSLR